MALAEGRPATEKSSNVTEGGPAEDRTRSPPSDKVFIESVLVAIFCHIVLMLDGELSTRQPVREMVQQAGRPRRSVMLGG